MEASGCGDVQSDARSDAKHYARIHSGRWAAGGQPAESIRQMLGSSIPGLTVCSGNGAPCAMSPTATLARTISGDGAAIISPQAFALGLAGTGALFHLILALSSQPSSKPSSQPDCGQSLLLATAGDGEFAALQLELP
jgi:hypothetical protein